MCGIAGYILKSPVEQRSAGHIPALLGPIRPRGPDDEGLCLIDREWHSARFYRTDLTIPKLANLPAISGDAGCYHHDAALIHTRYAIIDLTEGGHQPFVSADGSIIAVVNGEIYNYLELQASLRAEGVVFRTHSDTEVLVEGYRIWGHELWNKMNGFWAVALYDRLSDEMVFSRDRIGVAPLYYRELPEGFFFASQIRSLIDISPRDVEIDADVVQGFVRTGIKDHDSSTFYRQIRSLPSLTTTIFPRSAASLDNAKTRKYWDIPSARLTPEDISFDEAVQRFRDIFFNAVELRLRADVKVAFELSGGLDSSSVVAAAATICRNNITSYTIKVPDADEEMYARSLLEYYPVDFRVLNDLESDYLHDCNAFSSLMTEPFHSPNIYTHYRMRRLMKDEGVFVVVMGAGGDELLAGYEASFWPQAFAELKSSGNLAAAYCYELARRFMTWKRARLSLLHFLMLPFKRISSYLKKPKIKKEMSANRASVLQNRYYSLPFHQQALYHFNVALIPYYMRSNDQFTMSIPLEHRFPLLDYRLVEMCLQLPITYLMKNGWTKYILRKAMAPYLPKKIIWRRQKMGFPFPYNRFLSQYRGTFEPIMKILPMINFPVDEYPDYSVLLKESPTTLWRLISTAIWARQFIEDNSIENRFHC